MLPSKDCGEPGEEGGRSWRLYWWDGTQGHGKSSRYSGHQPEILLFLVQTMLNIYYVYKITNTDLMLVFSLDIENTNHNSVNVYVWLSVITMWACLVKVSVCQDERLSKLSPIIYCACWYHRQYKLSIEFDCSRRFKRPSNKNLGILKFWPCQVGEI